MGSRCPRWSAAVVVRGPLRTHCAVARGAPAWTSRSWGRPHVQTPPTPAGESGRRGGRAGAIVRSGAHASLTRNTVPCLSRSRGPQMTATAGTAHRPHGTGRRSYFTVTRRPFWGPPPPRRRCTLLGRAPLLQSARPPHGLLPLLDNQSWGNSSTLSSGNTPPPPKRATLKVGAPY